MDNGVVPTCAPISDNRRRRRTSLSEYESLLDSHRCDLGAHAHARAAEAAGVSYNTALKAFRSGLGVDMPAIRTVIQREMAEARAILGRESLRRDDEARSVRRHAKRNVQQRATDGRVLVAARTNVAAVLALSGNLIARALQLTEVFAAAIEDPQWRPTPPELMTILRAICCISRQAAVAEERVSKMEERVLGALESPAARASCEMTAEEAVQHLLSAERTLNRLRRRQSP